MTSMQRLHHMTDSERDANALEVNAASARLAFLCPYSSSGEYEAEIIAARRAAGAYRPQWQQMAVSAALAGTGAIFLFGLFIARL
jgi:hypothetical protein